TSSYQPRYFTPDTLWHDTTNHRFVLTTSSGQVVLFNDFTVSPAGARGGFVSLTDAGGNVTSTVTDGTNGTNTEIDRHASDGSVVEVYSFTYIASGVNQGKVQSVALERYGDVIRQTIYSYYDGT